MLFTSTVFLFLFFPIVILIYYNPFFKGRVFKNIFLLISSFLFYAWGEPVFIFLIMISTIVTWYIGRLIENCGGGGYKKSLLIICILYHLGILFLFKYLTFIIDQFEMIVHKQFDIPEISLPIGISFFTFQMMSYIFDVYYEKVPSQNNLFYLGLYFILFPQLIAGPIVRYNTLADEIEDRKESFENFEYGIRRFVIGLGKKVLIADVLAEIADGIFVNSSIYSIGMATAWIGSFAYTFEIYFDFSAYSDMAIGLGRCFGFHFLENFNYPYIADSITEFWKRWHISLTDWFRDYVYIPFGGNRVKKKRHIFNIILVWILTGIWHGASWTFLLWSGIYCLFQLMERYVYSMEKIPSVLGHIYTLFIVNFCWVIFRADNIKIAIYYIGVMFGINGIVDINTIPYLRNGAIIFLIAIIGCTPLMKMLHKILVDNGLFGKFIYAFEYITLFVILILVISISISGGYSPFIYFNF